MSKLAKIPVIIKEGVEVFLENNSIKVNGPKGTLTFVIPSGVKVESIDEKLQISLVDKKNDKIDAMLGLTRAIIANMVTGVNTGFEKKLELSGVGYRASLTGNELTLSLGFSHPVKVVAPKGITFTVAENIITVSGVDKDLVGNTASRIRGIRPPEPYKGKGIKYQNEKIRRKAGKAAKALGVTK